MSSLQLTHAYAALQHLEKCLQTVKKLLVGRESEYPDIVKVIPEQEKIITQMRRVANVLQLEIARNDAESIVRSYKVFYGYNQMVRTDLLKALSVLSNKEETSIALSETEIDNRVMIATIH